jgi:hypothetical protein
MTSVAGLYRAQCIHSQVPLHFFSFYGDPRVFFHPNKEKQSLKASKISLNKHDAKRIKAILETVSLSSKAGELRLEEEEMQMGKAGLGRTVQGCNIRRALCLDDKGHE